MKARIALAVCAASLILAPGCATVRIGQLGESGEGEGGSASQMALREAARELVELARERDWTTGDTPSAAARHALAVLMHGADPGAPPPADRRVEAYLEEAHGARAPASVAIGGDAALLHAHVVHVNNAASAVVDDVTIDVVRVGADLRRLEEAIRRAREAHRLFVEAVEATASDLSADERAALEETLARTAREIEVMSVRADDLSARRSQGVAATVG